MNEILEKIGWGAVCVDGFIPPAAFMEFQKYKVLVIAADIRSINQLEYTPALDILTEAAGHAPFIADAEYAKYLRKFGKIGSNAFGSAYDHEVYEAIRHLSILKADPRTHENEIRKAEEVIADLEANPAPPSEMALIRNLHWWTVEYGLIGTIEEPKIYGAGLLSSIGESVLALSDQVKKIEYSLEAMDYSFDITKPQPQLFVTPDFKHLNIVLEEFSNRMSMKIGGIHGMNKAIESKNLATAELKSGLQISGVFTNIMSQGANIIYLQSTGPTMLSYKDKMLSGHGKDYHIHGYGTAVGKIKGALKPMKKLEDQDLNSLGIIIGQYADIEFDSNIHLKGKLKSFLRKDGKLLLLSFEDCTVEYHGKLLFQPGWGIYDMGIGENISSVYAGVADSEGFGLQLDAPSEVTHKINYTPEEKYLFTLYDKVRALQNQPYAKDSATLVQEILEDYPQDWLLQLEAVEFLKDSPESRKLRDHLNKDIFTDSEHKLIELGLKLID